jgi:hypothetical protein
MKTRLALLAAITATVAATLSPNANAYEWYSPYAVANVATCRTGVIDVSAPAIQVMSTGPGLVAGGSQWTAFESILERWNPTLGRWVDVYRSEPYFHLADYVPMDPEEFWYLSRSGTWNMTTQGQSIPMAGRSGYFRYSLHIYWFDQQNRVSAQQRLVGQGMADERGIDDRLWRYRDYCYYP